MRRSSVAVNCNVDGNVFSTEKVLTAALDILGMDTAVTENKPAVVVECREDLFINGVHTSFSSTKVALRVNFSSITKVPGTYVLIAGYNVTIIGILEISGYEHFLTKEKTTVDFFTIKDLKLKVGLSTTKLLGIDTIIIECTLAYCMKILGDVDVKVGATIAHCFTKDGRQTLPVVNSLENFFSLMKVLVEIIVDTKFETATVFMLSFSTTKVLEVTISTAKFPGERMLVVQLRSAEATNVLLRMAGEEKVAVTECIHIFSVVIFLRIFFSLMKILGETAVDMEFETAVVFM